MVLGAGDTPSLRMRVTTAPAFTGHDQYLFREGTHARLYEKLGAHLLREGEAVRAVGQAVAAANGGAHQ